MNKRFNKKSLFCVIAVFVCVLFASPVFAAADRPISANPGEGLVMSASWLADEVGQYIMNVKGGNAVDAAAAVGYALAVVWPTAGNLGGGGFAGIHMNGWDKPRYLDFRERAPGAAHALMYVDTDDPGFVSGDISTYKRKRFEMGAGASGNASLVGYLAAGVPGSVAGMNEMVKQYGNLTIAEVLAPAIQLAANGFPLPLGTANSISGSRNNFMPFEGSRKYFVKDPNDASARYQEGEIFVQRDLAKTLKRIADADGDAGFYEGATAALIVADMPKYGGIITLEDLKNYRAIWRDPVEGTYRGYKIFSMPPPSSGGVTVLQILNTIEHDPTTIATMGFNSLRKTWLMTEATRYAYADRGLTLGDPDFHPEIMGEFVPKLVSKDYAKEIYDKIIAYGELKARPSSEVNPGVGPLTEGENTTHYSIIDKDGNTVGVTYTINSGYGCRIAVDGAGFFMNNEMDDFATFPTDTRSDWVRNGIKPGKTPLSSMSPQIVLRPNNSLFLMTGSPGGNTIINTNLHCVINAIDHSMNVSEMAAAPRTHHQWKNNDGMSESPLQYETMFGFTNDAIQALRDMGYPLSTGSNGTVCAIMVDSSGNVTGSHDPRSFDDPPAFDYQKLMEWIDDNK